MKAQIFDHTDYKDFLKAWIQARPTKGRGELKRMAEHLRVHATLMSQVVNGSKDLPAEQALELGRYLHLSEAESEYFLCLVQQAKAGTKNLKAYYENKLNQLRSKSLDLSAKFESKSELAEAERAEFYSNWYYSAIRLATDLPGLNSVDKIAKALSLPKQVVKEKLDFLLRVGLCNAENGSLKMGPSLTHVDARSPYVVGHHRNWRLKAMERHGSLGEADLIFTSPVTIAEKDALEFKKNLVHVIEELKKLVTHSRSEQMVVFNLDWVKVFDC